MPKIVSVKSFYESGCKSPLDELIRDKNRYTVLYSCIRIMCESLSVGLPHNEILNAIKMEMESSYEDSFFNFAWQKNICLADDLKLFSRFLSWLGENKVICGQRELVGHVTENTILTSHVDMILENSNGTVSAFVIHPGKSTKSAGGKSVHTAISTDLYAMVAKLCLEAEYPDCIVNIVYLRNSQDSDGHIGSFRCDSSKKSNVFSLNYLDYYNEDGFDRDVFSKLMLHVMNTPVQSNCYDCLNKQLCKLGKRDMNVLNVKHDIPVKKTYQMPAFTDVQKQVVEHKEGPMLVCAGPGSGKTATIVGRIKQLIDNGVPAMFILAITFTNKAADELKERCLSFCESDFMPTIQTLNAFGYSILRKNEDCLGKVELLTQMEKYRLLSALLENRPPISGFSYGNITGNSGLLATIERKISQYKSADDRESFLIKESLSNDFVELYHAYQSVLLSRGYITFDEQISRCLDLFSEYPERLAAIQKRYQYILVDEYQDIDNTQAEFIYQIAAHGNIMAVGDDDQSIYGFRGGSNRFMLDFSKHFRNAKTVVLSDNFRSTKPIVDVAQHVISRNSSRIPKQITARKQGGIAPVTVSGGIKEINDIVHHCISAGYQYGDIAVLASKNATLEDFAMSATFPHVLEKMYLIEDSFFNIVRTSLDIILHGPTDKSFVSLAMAMHVPLTPVSGLSQYAAACKQYSNVLHGEYVVVREDEPMTKLLHVLLLAKSMIERSASSYVECIAATLGMEETLSYEHLSKLAAFKNTNAFWEVLQYMVDFSDDTRLENNYDNAVLYMTSHDAKGKEFPVVIMVDDFQMEEEENVRLYYVAITRAKEELYVIKKPGKETLLQSAI